MWFRALNWASYILTWILVSGESKLGFIINFRVDFTVYCKWGIGILSVISFVTTTSNHRISDFDDKNICFLLPWGQQGAFRLAGSSWTLRAQFHLTSDFRPKNEHTATRWTIQISWWETAGERGELRHRKQSHAELPLNYSQCHDCSCPLGKACNVKWPSKGQGGPDAYSSCRMNRNSHMIVAESL